MGADAVHRKISSPPLAGKPADDSCWRAAVGGGVGGQSGPGSRSHAYFGKLRLDLYSRRGRGVLCRCEWGAAGPDRGRRGSDHARAGACLRGEGRRQMAAPVPGVCRAAVRPVAPAGTAGSGAAGLAGGAGGFLGAAVGGNRPDGGRARRGGGVADPRGISGGAGGAPRAAGGGGRRPRRRGLAGGQPADAGRARAVRLAEAAGGGGEGGAELREFPEAICRAHGGVAGTIPKAPAY
jgi:hypothetical protein